MADEYAVSDGKEQFDLPLARVKRILAVNGTPNTNPEATFLVCRATEMFLEALAGRAGGNMESGELQYDDVAKAVKEWPSANSVLADIVPTRVTKAELLANPWKPPTYTAPAPEVVAVAGTSAPAAAAQPTAKAQAAAAAAQQQELLLAQQQQQLLLAQQQQQLLMLQAQQQQQAAAAAAAAAQQAAPAAAAQPAAAQVQAAAAAAGVDAQQQQAQMLQMQQLAAAQQLQYQQQLQLLMLQQQQMMMAAGLGGGMGNAGFPAPDQAAALGLRGPGQA